MVTFFARVIHWFHPIAEVPEEEDRHKEAISERNVRVAELRSRLQTDPELEAKLAHISNLLK